MTKRLVMGAVILLVLVCSLILHAPAWVLDKAVRGHWQASAWGGSVVEGESQGSLMGNMQQLAWHWHPAALLRLALTLDLRARGGLTSDGQVTLTPLRKRFEADRLDLSAALASQMLTGSQLPAWSGRGIVLEHDHGGWSEASGVLRSPGGAVRLNLQGQVYELTLPPVVLRLAAREGDLVIDLRQQADNGVLATVTLTASQRIKWQVHDRLLRLKTGYVSQNNPDLVVLTVSEPL